MFNLFKNFLLVRHAPGGAGRFLIATLMASKSIAHFDPAIENNKTDQKCLDYLKDRFTINLDDWLKKEPNPVDAWNLHFVSSKYTRGETLTVDEFVQNALSDGTEHFKNSINQNKLISLSWLKTTEPEYFAQAKNIIILIDPESIKWLHRANWYKHYSFTENGIHIKINDPIYYNNSMSSYAKKFNNPTYCNDHPYSFIKKNIINCKFKKLFSDIDNFKNLHNKCFINLSSMLSEDSFVNTIDRITSDIKINTINQDFLRAAHNHWINCHSFKYVKNS